jgi:transposase
MATYIGLDGHSKTSTFVTVNESGKVLNQSQVVTCERDLLAYVRGQKGTKKLIFEESHLSQWFFALFSGEVDDLTVCHPGYLGKKQGPKDDLRDATHLANELRCGHVIPVYHDQSRMMELRSLVSAYRDLVHEIVRSKNRYKALFRSEAIKTPGVAVYRSDERIKELSRTTDRFVAEGLLKQIMFLEERKKVFKEQFVKNMKKHPEIARLAQIPGIESVRANIISALICSPERFENKHKLWAYSMLVKHDQQSDGKSYGKIKVMGRVELKEVFLGAAESILQTNEDPLRLYYEHLRRKGCAHHNAKMSLARKIAAICLAVLKNKKSYDEEIIRKQLKTIS